MVIISVIIVVITFITLFYQGWTMVLYGGVEKNVYHAYESDHTSSEDKEDVLLRDSSLFS